MSSPIFPGWNKVFLIRPSIKSTHCIVSVQPGDIAIFRKAIRNRYTGKPINMHIMSGDLQTDVMWAMGTEPVFSSRFITALNESCISGWSTYQVVLYDSSEHVVEGYHGLSVIGVCGNIDYSRSLMSQRDYPTGMHPSYRGYYFDESTWDGSDVFMASGSGHRFATESFRSVVDVNNITGLALDLAKDVWVDPWIVQRHMTGKLLQNLD